MSPIEIRTVTTLSLIYALRMFGLFMVLPVLALFANDYQGASASLVGVAIGVYGLTQACLQLPFGVWSDRIGRKPVIVIGLALFSLGSGLAAMADNIWLLILGRALQGAGAVASTLMALMTDLTREENRTKAMASIGASIGASFTLAMVAGPLLASWMGLSGLFVLTAVLSLLAIVLLLVAVPTPQHALVSRDVRVFSSQLSDVLKHSQILRLSFGIFVLHGVLVACFVALPVALVDAGLAQAEHWQIYLPVMLVAFVVMLPFIIVGEKKHKMKQVLLFAVVLLASSVVLLGFELNSVMGIGIALWLFFVAFNILEASLPSLVSKFAPAGFKGSAMGVYSTCQFLGAFVGGVSGGFLSEQYGLNTVFWGMVPLLMVWAVLVMTMEQPRHWVSYRVALTCLPSEYSAVQAHLLALPGVHEVAMIDNDRAAYLKIDSKVFDAQSLKHLTL